jgi:superoxide oxidase
MMAERYSTPIILLHWCTAVLVIVAYVLSEGSRHFGDNPPLLHFSMGFAVLVLAVARLAARVCGEVPLAHPLKRAWLARLASIVHATFYVLLIAIPLSGWYAVSKLSLSVSLLGWTVPAIAVPSPELAPGSIGRLHQVGGNLLLILAGLHGLAALWRQFALKDNIFKRISPF